MRISRNLTGTLPSPVAINCSLVRGGLHEPFTQPRWDFEWFDIYSKKKKKLKIKKNYLGINLTKEVKDLYNENFKTLKI